MQVLAQLKHSYKPAAYKLPDLEHIYLFIFYSVQFLCKFDFIEISLKHCGPKCSGVFFQ